MKKFIKRFLQSCMMCMSSKPSGMPPQWLNLPIGQPFEILAMDIWGPLDKTRNGYEHVLVFIDHHTRWVELCPLRAPTAEAVAAALFKNWITRWGVPRTLLTDNGPQFTSRIMKSLCEQFGIRKAFASPYNPRGNSIVESYMRSLKSTIKMCIEVFSDEWDAVLPAAAFAYRTAIHISTGYSPFFLATGQQPVLPITRELHEPVLQTRGDTWLKVLWMCRRKLVEEHRRQLEERQAVFDSKGLKFREGQVIAVKIPLEKRRTMGKFASLYDGPFRVVEVLARGASARVVDMTTAEEQIINRTNAKLLNEVPRRDITSFIPSPQLD